MRRGTLNLGLVRIGVSYQLHPAPGFGVTFWTHRSLRALKERRLQAMAKTPKRSQSA